MNFAAIVVEECAARGLSHVIDVGSGVGHLAQHLASAGMPRVTAIEGNSSHHTKAGPQGWPGLCAGDHHLGPSSSFLGIIF